MYLDLQLRRSWCRSPACWNLVCTVLLPTSALLPFLKLCLEQRVPCPGGPCIPCQGSPQQPSKSNGFLVLGVCAPCQGSPRWPSKSSGFLVLGVCVPCQGSPHWPSKSSGFPEETCPASGSNACKVGVWSAKQQEAVVGHPARLRQLTGLPGARLCSPGLLSLLTQGLGFHTVCCCS